MSKILRFPLSKGETEGKGMKGKGRKGEEGRRYRERRKGRMDGGKEGRRE